MFTEGVYDLCKFGGKHRILRSVTAFEPAHPRCRRKRQGTGALQDAGALTGIPSGKKAFFGG